jgi:hypothetical protein
MKKYIKIEFIEEDDDNTRIEFSTNGVSEFEIIGLLTYYRDKIEVDRMHGKPKTPPIE